MDTIAPAASTDESILDPDGDLAPLSTETILGPAADSSARITREKARFLRYTAEIGRREGFRTEGASSLENWLGEQGGESVASARSHAHVGAQLENLPGLAAGLASGDLTFEKVRAVVDMAAPTNEQDLADLAHEYTVRQLRAAARTERGVPRSRAETDHESRSVKFNDPCRTVTAQLPPESY